MELKIQALLERLIDDGITIALNTNAHLDSCDLTALSDQLRTEIWLQLDTYFNFDD